jgi:iron complex transport system ATP-binding protein
VIAARGLSVERAGRVVVSGIDLEIVPGKVVGLVGPNGAGKSTILRAFAGELAPSAGRVELDGTPLDTIDRRALARRRAVVSQHHGIAFAFRVDEVVALGRSPHGDAGSALVAAALAAVGLEGFGARAVDALSGGELRRVHLARALAQLGMPSADEGGGRYLLLDEPLAHLDPAEQVRVIGLVGELRARGVGVLVVHHDLERAAATCDEVALIAAGRLVGRGPPREVLTVSTLSDAFGAEAQILDVPGDAGAPVIRFVARGRTSP